MLELKNAPFKLDDAELVPEAGPCTTCTKRTGSQGALFQDCAPDLCADPTCHRSKVDALYKLRVKQAVADGQEVLSKKASVEALKDGARSSYGTGPYVRLDEKVYVEGKGGRSASKSLKSLFGKELPPVTLARDEETGAQVELVPRTAVAAVVAAANPQTAKANTSRDTSSAKEREKERFQAEVRKRCLVALVEATEDLDLKPGTDDWLEMLRVLVRCAINTARPDVRKAVANRRGCPLVVEEGEATSKRGKGKHQQVLAPDERLERLLPSLNSAQLTGLLLEILVGAGAPGKWAEAHSSYTNACEVLSVDVKAFEGNLKAELADKAEAKAKGAKKPKAKAKSAKKKPKKHKPKAPAPDPREQHDREDDAGDDLGEDE
jgi:hypothetical protein